MTDNPYSAPQTDDREPWVWQLVYGWCVLWVFIVALFVFILSVTVPLLVERMEQWRRDREDVRYYIRAAKESRERIRER